MSSLPKAKKEISSTPAKGSVVSPVDKQTKAADVERKIRIYGAIDALRQHKLPSNGQINAALQYLVDASPSSLESLSAEGKRLTQDVKQVVATLRFMLMEKNADEMIQDLTWKLTDTGNPLKGDERIQGSLAKGKEKMLDERDQAVKHLRTIVTLVLTNSEVRKLLGDFSTIGRDLLAHGAGKAASAIAPPASALEEVDKPAPDNEFVTEGGRKVGSDETPVLEARLAGIGGAKMDPHTGGAQAFQEVEGGERKQIGEVSGLGDAREKIQGIKQGAMETAVGVGQEGVQNVQEMKQASDTGDEAAVDAKKGGMKQKMRQFRDDLRNGVNDAMPQQNKDANNERMERAKKFFSDEYFPKERRDQFIFRGKKVILECQNHDDYQDAMSWLISFFEGNTQRGYKTAGDAGHNVSNSGITKNPTLNLCIAELRTLLERFANNTSMELFIDAIRALADDADRDSDLRHWFSAVSAYAKRVLLEPGYLLDDNCNTEGNKLRQSGKLFYDEKYRDHFNNLFDSIGRWFGAMREDPINRKFGEDWAKLTKDLLFDSEGSLKFKPDLWNDIRKVILPTIIHQVGYVPIPRIEYTDEGLDLVIENLTLQGSNIFPNIVALETNNFMKFSPYSSIKDVAQFHVTLSLQQVQADMRDVAFYYRKKTGLPKMKDSGIADVLLGGSGLSASIELVSSPDPSSVFKVHKINVKVDTLKFAIRESNHDFLYKTLRPLATGLIKKQIQKAVGDGLRTFFEYIDEALVSVRDRMGQVTDSENKGEVLKEIFSRKKQDNASGSSTSSNSAERKGSQFKIVGDKRDSMLAGVGHPSGILNRTAEMHNIAKGEGVSMEAPAGHVGVPGAASGAKISKNWKSEAFTMQGGHGNKGNAPGQSHIHTQPHTPGKNVFEAQPGVAPSRN